jgi:hypothetical protein
MDTEAKEPFFGARQNVELFRRLSNALESMDPSVSTPAGIAAALKQIVDLVLTNAEKFDEYSASNIEWIGASFMSEVREFLKLDEKERGPVVGGIFASAYRFLRELEFNQPGEPSFELRQVKSFVHEHLDEFLGRDKAQLVYASYLLPADVVRRLVNHPSITDFRRFTETADAARKLKEQWDKELTERQTILAAMEDGLKNITSGYNFVGLVHGFQQLARAKIFEKTVAFASLLGLGLLMLLPVVLQIRFVVINIDSVESHKAVLIYTLPAIIALEVILLYFFRVVLIQFRSVKAQLLQLDLRIALCQFIQSYAEYSAKIKGQDKNALAKFESLIFSGLVAEESGIPSTLDGVEQLASLIKNIRGAP